MAKSLFFQMRYETTPLPNLKPCGGFGLYSESNVSFFLWFTVPHKVWSLPPPLTTSCPIDPLFLFTSATVASFLLHNTLELFLASGSLQLLVPLPEKLTSWLFTLLALCQPSGLSLNKASLKRLSRASLVAQWLRICLPMQVTRDRKSVV